jgi:competence protein ComGC
LVELAAVVGVISVLFSMVAPAVEKNRILIRAGSSTANLMVIGQGTAMYAADHDGRLFTYTWRPGQHLMPDGNIRTSFSDQEAASWQNTEILMRRTGRIEGNDRIFRVATLLAHRASTHLVLMDYLNQTFPSSRWADPADANLLQWQANPLDISRFNNIPYASGSQIPAGYDSPGAWNNAGALQRWAFSSSYQRTISAWCPDGFDGTPTYAPVSFTPHLVTGNPLAGALPSGRTDTEVLFPSQKVHYFEEFDRTLKGLPTTPYFAYNFAAPRKVMFDGSINTRPSGQARSSRSPAQPTVVWNQTYVPLHTFPIPMGGLGDNTLLNQRYRWTRYGLEGIDY